MNTQKIPVITMLLAGLTALLIMAVRGDMKLNNILLTLFIVFLLFYIFGDIVKAVVDRKIRRIEKAEAEELERQEAEEGERKPDEKASL